MLTLLTATGCRPVAWSLCQQLMLNQRYEGKVRWIVVDDGEQPQEINFKRDNWMVEIIRPNHRWSNGQNTQSKNLLAGLRHVDNKENLVIIEDDDFYHPDYLTNLNKWLEKSNLVGESAARYYNIKTRKYRQLSNYFHASLCATAMKNDAIDLFKNVCTGKNIFIDLELWKAYKGSKQLYKSNLTVGIKGLPGRSGIGVGHKKDFQGKIDQDGSVLQDWIGDFVSLYEQH